MKILKTILAALSVTLMCLSCDVHEFPDTPATRQYVLRLKYETDLPIWHWDYSVQTGLTSKDEVMTKSVMPTGQMRYIIRTYPQTKKTRAASPNDYIQEFVFTKDVAEGYDHELTLDIIPGEYKLMVWSDLVEYSSDVPYYNYSDFSGITYLGEHAGNTDYRDAFRGYADIAVDNSFMVMLPDTTDIPMERPLAKYEFFTDDLKIFMENEQTKADLKSKAEVKGDGSEEDEVKSTKISIGDYRVVFYYPGFMPSEFSMFTDKAVDSVTGMQFHSTITQISDTEASIGFDYVFVNHKQASVSVQIGIYNKEGEELSLSNPIEVPLKRSYHTILKGKFLTQKASGGITINPDFEGDYNVII